MSKSNTLAEKLIMFAVFFVFAVLVVAFAYGWDDITGKHSAGSASSFAYQTSSKSDTAGALGNSTNNTGLININTATEAELDTLPGIGATRAKAIVDYRNENGPFRAVTDIKNVKGIGDGIYDEIKDIITVG